MLDGKYEITSERELGDRATLFGATAPDGTAVAIYWYELETPADERAFERYRALLRGLRREGHAAVYDLVSRPGAHYVAWRLPDEGAQAATADLRALKAALGAHGRTLDEAIVRSRPDATAQIYGLAFAGTLEPLPSPKPASTTSSAPHKAVDNLWITLWRGVRPWALAGALALSGTGLFLLGLVRLQPGGLVYVPDLREQEVNAALAALHRAGFAATPVGLASPRPAGTVLETVPPAGTPLRPGRTLSVRYALPAGRTSERAPSVVGRTLEGAAASLGRARFRVGRVAHSFSSAPAGTVVAQLPAAAAPAAPGGDLTLLVSDGPRGATTFLPDLTGLPLEGALRLAEAAGFPAGAVRLERVRGSGEGAGTVLAQNVAPFVAAPLGEAHLRLTVAAASAAAPEGGTPDLTGLGLEEAQQRARTLGLSVQVTAELSAPELPDGVVLQRPPPGAPLEGRVRVTLNAAAREIVRPDVLATVRLGETPPPPAVRRARYAWQLGADAAGGAATVTVTLADGTQRTVVRGQTVGANERLEGTYLTTARGPLVFTLTLDGRPYGAPLTVP